LALANAINFELAPSPVCKSTVNVINGTEIEKILCHVNRDMTAYRARLICEANGMRLFQPKSSVNARTALVSFGKTRFGGSSKAQFYVHGRRGNVCQTARGNGALTEYSCDSTFNVLCEHFDVNGLLCDPSTTTGCDYQSAITKDNMTMYVKDPDTYEDVTYLFISNEPRTRFLPVDLATTFPNLSLIYSFRCSIATLNRRTFAGLTKLTLLNLDNNQIKVLQSSIFAGLSKIAEFSFCKCEVLVQFNFNIFL
jgi:Leucine-rich repeat (LRR) protein